MKSDPHTPASQRVEVGQQGAAPAQDCGGCGLGGCASCDIAWRTHREEQARRATAEELAESRAEVLSFAESRAEDMSEEVEVTPEEWHSEQSMEEAISLRDKAWAAVTLARAVLRRSGRHE